jgi:uncharacterized protein YndB with AHSA1/START domain
MSNDTNSLSRSITIKAPRSRVWQALTDSKQFGQWFGVTMETPFHAGKPAYGIIDNPNFKGMKMELAIDRVEPESFFSWRWHPYAVDPKVDYSKETPTLVTFELSEKAGVTTVVITESGFDKIPKHRQPDAFRMNGDGWSIQAERIRDYVEKKTA